MFHQRNDAEHRYACTRFHKILGRDWSHVHQNVEQGKAESPPSFLDTGQGNVRPSRCTMLNHMLKVQITKMYKLLNMNDYQNDDCFFFESI
jgi:hypothetical protein